MIQNLIITLEIVFPFVAFMVLGALLRRMKLMREDFTEGLNRLLFYVFLPINAFNGFYSQDLKGVFHSPRTFYILGGMILSFIFLLLIVPRMEKDPARQGAMIHAGYRGNAILFAMPLGRGIFGEDVPEVVFSLAAGMVFFNVISIPLMEYYRAKVRQQRGSAEAGGRISLGKLVQGLLKTPLFIGVLLGIAWTLFKLPRPQILQKMVTDLSAPVIPLAFMLLGARLRLVHLKANSRNVFRISFFKIVLLPCLMMIFPLLAGWGQRDLVSVLLCFGAPSAVIVFPMTSAYECDGEMAGEIISTTTFFSLFTLFLAIFALKQLGLLS